MASTDQTAVGKKALHFKGKSNQISQIKTHVHKLDKWCAHRSIFPENYCNIVSLILSGLSKGLLGDWDCVEAQTVVEVDETGGLKMGTEKGLWIKQTDTRNAFYQWYFLDTLGQQKSLWQCSQCHVSALSVGSSNVVLLWYIWIWQIIIISPLPDWLGTEKTTGGENQERDNS